MIRHNLKPEVVPLVRAVLAEKPKQTKSRLADRGEDGNLCYCIEGIICEAYRRAHPDTSRWAEDEDGDVYFFVDLPPNPAYVSAPMHHDAAGRACSLPSAVSRWAHSDGLPSTVIISKDGSDAKYADGLNDNGTSLEEFDAIFAET